MCVTASTSMVRLEVVTQWAPLSSCTVLPSFNRAGKMLRQTEGTVNLEVVVFVK